jgi:hypothetical protein
MAFTVYSSVTIKAIQILCAIILGTMKLLDRRKAGLEARERWLQTFDFLLDVKPNYYNILYWERTKSRRPESTPKAAMRTHYRRRRIHNERLDKYFAQRHLALRRLVQEYWKNRSKRGAVRCLIFLLLTTRGA